MSDPKRPISGLFALVERACPEGGDWCDIAKADQLVALVLANRPRVIVEIGVFLGGSLIPLALAQQTYAVPAREVCWAVDPWSPDASKQGQNEVNAQWWGKLDHESILQRFVARVERYDLGHLVAIARETSDEFSPPGEINLCHIDGNHGEQARRDVEKLAPRIPVGGILILDDLDWEGGSVRAGRDLALAMGFRELYRLGTGVVMRRDSLSALGSMSVH